MILTMDVGNTNTVLGIYKNGDLYRHWRISTDKNKTADEYGVLFSNFFAFSEIKKRDIRGLTISSVVPPVEKVLLETSKKYLEIDPLVIGPGVKTNTKIMMDNPDEVGADRIVNAVAAYHKYGGPAIIIDFGTATTFCAVSVEGDYLGGAIAPGVEISTEALYEHAAKLPRIALKKPDSVIGKDTVSSMQSGIIYGFVGQVESLIEKFKQELGRDCRVIATGGLAELITTDKIDVLEPFLTLEGLYYIGKLNGIRE